MWYIHNIHTSNTERMYKHVPTVRNMHILYYKQIKFWKSTKSKKTW